MTRKLKKMCRQAGAHIAIVPSGCTSVVQPLDVGVNKVFKGHLRGYWNEWMANPANHSYTNQNNLRAPPVWLVCQWIESAWGAIQPSTIQNAFRACKLIACTEDVWQNALDDIRNALHEVED